MFYNHSQEIEQHVEQWYIAKFKQKFWKQLSGGGNSHRKINVDSLMPEFMFNKYVRFFEGRTFGGTVLQFKGTSIISTQDQQNHCPYMFAAWFFRNCNTLQTRNLKNAKVELVDIFNCRFQYSTNSYKLSFTSDVTWTINKGKTWQKLSDVK